MGSSNETLYGTDINWERINKKVIKNEYVFGSAIYYHTKLIKRGLKNIIKEEDWHEIKDALDNFKNSKRLLKRFLQKFL